MFSEHLLCMCEAHNMYQVQQGTQEMNNRFYVGHNFLVKTLINNDLSVGCREKPFWNSKIAVATSNAATSTVPTM